MANFAIIDCEYVQFSISDRRIIEIGIVLMNDQSGHLELIDQYQTLINPGRPCPKDVLKLTGITQLELDSAPRFDLVAEMIELLTREQTLVGHNIKEDFKALQSEFDVLGLDFRRKSTCTFDLAKASLPELPSYELKNLCHWFNIKLDNHHRALDDAMATAELFCKLYEPHIRKREEHPQVTAMRCHPKLNPKLFSQWKRQPAVIDCFKNGQLMAMDWVRNLHDEGPKLLVQLHRQEGHSFDKIVIHDCTDPIDALLRFRFRLKKLKPLHNVKEEAKLWVVERLGWGFRLNKWNQAKGTILFQTKNRKDAQEKLHALLENLDRPKLYYRDPEDTEWKKEQQQAHREFIQSVTKKVADYPENHFAVRFGSNSPSYLFYQGKLCGKRYIKQKDFPQLRQLPEDYRKIYETPQIRHQLIHLLLQEKNRHQKEIEFIRLKENCP